MANQLELILKIDVPASDAAPDGALTLEVRTYAVAEEMNRPFEVDITAASPSASLDLEELVGATATFRMIVRREGDALPLGPVEARSWTGYLAEIRQVSSEEGGRSFYRLRIVPPLWLLTQKVDTRIFQHLSELEVALKVLSLWGIEPELRVDRESHLRREYRTQYEESDFDFVNRMLEEAGVTYFFESKADGGGKMVVTDAPQLTRARPRPLAYAEIGDVRVGLEWASDLQLVRRVAPGRVTLTDHDFRKPPDQPLVAEAKGGKNVEQKLDVYEYRDGHFLYIAGDAADPEDPADAEAVFRTDEKRARALAVQRLRSQRGKARETTFSSNAFDLEPGDVVKIEGHTRAELAKDGLLLVEMHLEGSWNTDWQIELVGVSAAEEYRPPMRTPRPVIGGVESATVVGPAGEEIHTDKHGRVKVHFHWDRDGKLDEYSSCWMHASQPWGGAGYGGTMLPRVGHEVLVGYFESDPDRPIIVGRYYTSLQQTPYKLPLNKTQSGFRTNSTGGGGGFNELMFEDKGGSELMRVRAQKDRKQFIGNDDRTRVQSNRGVSVGQNSNRFVGANEDGTIDGQQTTAVTGPTVITAFSSSVTTTVGGISLSSPAGISNNAPYVGTIAGKLASIQSGASRIYVTPGAIAIDSPAVFINPGGGMMDYIAFHGGPPKAPVEPQPPAFDRPQPPMMRKSEADQVDGGEKYQKRVDDWRQQNADKLAAYEQYDAQSKQYKQQQAQHDDLMRQLSRSSKYTPPGYEQEGL